MRPGVIYNKNLVVKKDANVNTLPPGSIMVQMAEPQWTLQALHLACAVARANGYPITLVKMVPVSHVGWLATELGYQHFTIEDRRLLQECSITAEDYGVPSSVKLFQYVTLSEAVVDAAEQFNPRIVFATLPHYKLPYWRKYLIWRMRHALEHQQRLLYTLEESLTPVQQTPSIIVPPLVEKVH
jgi:hypothetical protein